MTKKKVIKEGEYVIKQPVEADKETLEKLFVKAVRFSDQSSKLPVRAKTIMDIIKADYRIVEK